MDHLEKVALAMLAQAPVHSLELARYVDLIKGDDTYQSVPPTLPQWLDYLYPDEEMASANRVSMPLARQEQRATYFLAVAIAFYRRDTRLRWPDEPTKEDDLLTAIRDYHLAIMHAHALFSSKTVETATYRPLYRTIDHYAMRAHAPHVAWAYVRAPHDWPRSPFPPSRYLFGEFQTSPPLSAEQVEALEVERVD